MNKLEYIKQRYPDTMVLIKNGNFYRCYGQDPYILSYLLDYKVCSTDQSDMSGFPKDSIQKVLNALELKKISYKIMEIVNKELKIICECNFEEDNCYDGVYLKAYRYVIIKKKMDSMNKYIIKNIENNLIEDVLKELEHIVYNKIKYVK